MFLTTARSPEVGGLEEREVARPKPRRGSNSVKMRRTRTVDGDGAEHRRKNYGKVAMWLWLMTPSLAKILGLEYRHCRVC